MHPHGKSENYRKFGKGNHATKILSFWYILFPFSIYEKYFPKLEQSFMIINIQFFLYYTTIIFLVFRYSLEYEFSICKVLHLVDVRRLFFSKSLTTFQIITLD